MSFYFGVEIGSNVEPKRLYEIRYLYIYIYSFLLCTVGICFFITYFGALILCDFGGAVEIVGSCWICTFPRLLVCTFKVPRFRSQNPPGFFCRSYAKYYKMVKLNFNNMFFFVKQTFFLEIHLTLDVPRPMFFVFLVLVNGDVGDFHDDGSFTHGEPGARIFGGLRPSKLQRTGKTMKMCSYSTGSKINLTPFVALLLPGKKLTIYHLC